jgi:hypothetical protein
VLSNSIRQRLKHLGCISDQGLAHTQGHTQGADKDTGLVASKSTLQRSCSQAPHQMCKVAIACVDCRVNCVLVWQGHGLEQLTKT